MKRAEFRQDNFRPKVDREKGRYFNLTVKLHKEQAKNQPDLTRPRNVPLGSGSLGGIPKTDFVLGGLDEQARNDYERSKADRDARKAQRNFGPDLAYTRGGNQFFHSSPKSQARNDAGRGRQASGGGLPPGDWGPPKGFSFGARVDGAGVK